MGLGAVERFHGAIGWVFVLQISCCFSKRSIIHHNFTRWQIRRFTACPVVPWGGGLQEVSKVSYSSDSSHLKWAFKLQKNQAWRLGKLMKASPQPLLDFFRCLVVFGRLFSQVIPSVFLGTPRSNKKVFEQKLRLPNARSTNLPHMFLWPLQVACFKATIDSACCEAIESAKEVLATLATTWQAEVQENMWILYWCFVA